MNKHKYNEKDKKNFKKYAEKFAPKSNLLKDCVFAFVIGGTICVIGQGIGDIGKMFGVNEENVKILIPCSLIVLSCILTGLGLYQKIAKYAGAGTLVPITGFANAISSISIDSKAEGLILGVGANMFKISGPVIVYGTLTSVIIGIIYYITAII
ncbi:MAG: stage V sporulation protein AC [Ruminococcaceae bacterium]|nr:stage V sporulation protein AC [Oscillospiraceae bacterium]